MICSFAYIILKLLINMDFTLLHVYGLHVFAP